MGYGTSPRMRGKRINNNKRMTKTRNIPAYAGKTYHYFVFWQPDKEHPRVCGENCLPRFGA